VVISGLCFFLRRASFIHVLYSVLQESITSKLLILRFFSLHVSHESISSLIGDFKVLGPVYISRTLTGIKLNNNRTQYSIVQKFFGSMSKTLVRNYTKRKVFRLCLILWELTIYSFCSVPAQCLGYTAKKLLA